MNAEEIINRRLDLLDRIANQRKERCHAVLLEPEKYKICNGCQSLLFAQTIFCPFCNSYGFEHDPEAIRGMASLLGNRPLAVSCPVLPRETTPRALTFV
jgi:hypothetical protein